MAERLSYLGPADDDRLQVFLAAELARVVRARGQRLNAPEAVALITDEMHLAARCGATYDEVRSVGAGLLSRRDVLEGVADIVEQIRVEVLLDEGTRLIVLDRPLGGAGAVTAGSTTGPRHANRSRTTVEVTNVSAQSVFVSSHYPFWLVSDALRFDRSAAVGRRLDVPAGDVVQWSAGETRRVKLVQTSDARP